MTPPEPEPVDTSVIHEAEPAPEGLADEAPSAASPLEEETPEQFMRRLVEENSWRIKPRPPRPVPPPEPKSIHLMTPEEMHASLPVHLRRRRPDGSYYAMGLLSRMQTDLEELTQGKRAATYPEVDEYLGYALLAEGLAPRGLTAANAVQWWRAGGSEVLREVPDAENGSWATASLDDSPSPGALGVEERGLEKQPYPESPSGNGRTGGPA